MNRRRFLQINSAAVLGIGVSRMAQATETPKSPPTGVTIEKIDLYPVVYPMEGFFKFLSGTAGPQGRGAVVIKITASDGTVGWGQSVPVATWSYETLETATTALHHNLAPALIGHDPMDIDGAHARLDKALAPSFTTGMPITRAGLDIALHDLTGKLQQKNIAELWGKKPGGSVELSWTVNVTSIEDVEALMTTGRERGYRHFNIKVSPDPDFDVKLTREVRRLAPDCFLWTDANCGYAPETALAVAPRLADAGADVFEAPIRPNHISGYQALKKQAALPILMDEGVVAPVELEEFIKLGMLDGMAMKPARCGGLQSNRRQIELCEKHNLMWLGSGLTDPDISFVAMLILYAAYGLKKPAALNGPQFLTEQILTTPIKVEDGKAHVPSGPGLGIEVDEDKLNDLMKRTGGDKLLQRIT